MTRRKFQLFIASAAYPWQNLWAQDAKVILEKVTAAYESLNNYYFEGRAVSEATIKGHTTKNELTFTVAFQAPDSFRLEFRYPTAGNWLRVSDGKFVRESRSMTKESKKTPVDQNTPYILNGSPLYNFERLSKTSNNPKITRSEVVAVGGKQIECSVIEFESHRRELREGETPGPSQVWVAKDTSLVMRQEIRTISTVRGEHSEAKRTTTIEKFELNAVVSKDLFSTSEA